MSLLSPRNRTGARRQLKRRLGCEALEPRYLLAVSPFYGFDPDIHEDDPLQVSQICVSQSEARVRLQVVDLSGSPVTQVDVGQQFYLQAYVRDTRNGIPKGITSATIDVAYDPSRLSVTGRIEHGERFPDFRSGRTNQPGLLQNVGGSLWNQNWTDKDDPGGEDLLFQVQFTATAPGFVEFLTGRSQGIMLRSRGLLVPQRDIEYGRLALSIASDGDDGGGENTRHVVETQNDPLCHPGPEVRVRLQAVDLSGNPVTQVDVGEPFYLQAYVRDTRNGIPKGVSMATIDVSYDAVFVSAQGGIEHGERFPDFRSGITTTAGLLSNVGGSLWNANWTDKADPAEEDLLFQALFTGTGSGSVTFQSGRSQGIMLRSEGQIVAQRDIDYGRFTLGIGSDPVEIDDVGKDRLCHPGPEARVRLQATDLSGNPLTQVEAGQEFYVQAYVRDTRNGIPKGVSRATIDVAYDPSRVSVAGAIEHGERFPDFRSGTTTTAGLLSNVGGSLWNANWTDKEDPGEEDLLFRVPFTATSAGPVQFLTGPSMGIALRSPGVDVPNRDIEYGTLALTIDPTGVEEEPLPSEAAPDVPQHTGWHNPDAPFDVNGDGVVSPVDVLLVINALNRGGSGPVSAIDETDFTGYLDVNNDGHLTAMDALLVINYLNGHSPAAEGEAAFLSAGSMPATLPQPGAPEAASDAERVAPVDLAIPELSEPFPIGEPGLHAWEEASKPRLSSTDSPDRSPEALEDELLTTLEDELLTMLALSQA
jgi:hypothetical protein